VPRTCVWRWALSCLALALQAGAQAQQVCTAGQVPSAPATRFSTDADGHVTDTANQLMWLRCPLGQAWQAGRCDGLAQQLDWAASSASAERVNASGELFYNDWRLPSLRELATVAERACSQPRINLSVFPDTPASAFWTGTPSLKSLHEAYAFDFGESGVVSTARSALRHVRLVRNAP
jgi:hypothetical protein